jgi:hypothetical protein
MRRRVSMVLARLAAGSASAPAAPAAPSSTRRRIGP